ncbi:hypothetical protein [Pseudophaeobacter sp. 1A09344]|uniref:hypothetical protein n=1 Tax=Pseudophaeobacter sp. 1A09344 TaxID=3098144 RepID=UPI0034D66795
MIHEGFIFRICGRDKQEMLQRIAAVFPATTLAPDAEIVAYCRGPYYVYTHQAVAALRRKGLIARCLDGGLPEWGKDGRPVHLGAN